MEGFKRSETAALQGERFKYRRTPSGWSAVFVLDCNVALILATTQIYSNSQVTIKVSRVQCGLTLILASSGPLLESDTLVPCFSRCLYVFITPQRKALLFFKGTRIMYTIRTTLPPSHVVLKNATPAY